MSEEIIQARIVFDERSLERAMTVGGGAGGAGGGGFTEAFARTGLGLDTQIVGEIGAALAGATLVMKEIFNLMQWGFGKLVNASPHLQASMDLLNRTLKLTLRPIGDVISSLFRPFLISWLRIVLPIYKSWSQWFGEGGGLEARIEISEGFKEVWEGIKNWDFGQIMDGLKQAGSGFINLFKSFGTEVLGSQLDIFYEWWEARQEQFNTSGIFDTLWEMFKSAASGLGEWLYDNVLKKAWDWLLELVGIGLPEEDLKWWQQALQTGWEFFGDYLTNLGEAWWLGPLAPFYAAIKTIWDAFVYEGVQELVAELEHQLPGLMGAFNSLFGDGDDDRSIFGMLLQAGLSFAEWLGNPFMKTVEFVFTQIAKRAEDAGISIEDSLNEILHDSIDLAADILTGINRLNKTVTTTHIIRTIRKSG